MIVGPRRIQIVIHTVMIFHEQRALLDPQSLQGENSFPICTLSADDVHFSTTCPSFYPNSSRVPILDDSQHLIEQELKTLHDQEITFQKNLNRKQYEAIKEMRENGHEIIRPADKEGKVVVLDKDLYKMQVLDLLSQTDTYHLLLSDPTQD